MEYILLGLVILLFVFLLFREILCWYWKINGIVDILNSIDSKLEAISENAINQNVNAAAPSSHNSHILVTESGAGGTAPTPTEVMIPEAIKCPECGRRILVKDLNIGKNGSTECPHCCGIFTVESE